MQRKYRLATRIMGNTIIGFIFLCLLILVLELIFRQLGRFQRVPFSYDPHLIWRQKPYLSGEKKYGQGQVPGKAPFSLRFNNKGFRGPDIRIEKRKNTVRIMILGDSYTAGLDYPDDEIFTSLLETKLNAQSDRQFEVMNISAPAWGTDQQYIYWLTEGQNYQPDYLILMVSPNDLRETFNKKLIRLLDGELQIEKPHFSGRERLGWYLANRSSFFQYLQKQVFLTKYGDLFHIFRSFPVNYGIRDSTDWDAPLYLTTPYVQVEDSYTLFEMIIQELAVKCRKNGTRLLLTKIPTKAEFNDSYRPKEHDPSRVFDFLEIISEKNEIPLLNLNRILARENDPLAIFMHWEYHFNETGHEFVAEKLASFLQLQE